MTAELNDVKEIEIYSGNASFLSEAVNEKLKTGLWKILSIKTVEDQYWISASSLPNKGYIKKEPSTVFVLGRIKDKEA